MRVFGSKFVDQLKFTDSGDRYKSRLVAQSYGDHQAVYIARYAATVQRLTHRLIPSLAASIDDLILHICGVTQAYIQSITPLQHDVYIWPPREMNLSSNSV